MQRKGWIGAAAGGLLLAGYLVLLARRDLDARLPGGWLPLLAVIGLAGLAVLAALVWQAGPPRAYARRWVAEHPWTLAVTGVTLAAAAVRLLGLGFGLPYLDHPDEPAVADRALHILQSGDFNPHYFVYPNLYTYLEAAVFVPRFFALVSSGAVERLDAIRPADFYLWGRLLTAILGTLTVPVVYAAGRRLYGPAVGLIAAIFMATNSLHMQHSQFIATDAPAAFFSALALLAITYLLPAGVGRTDAPPIALAPRSAYLAAGVAMGLAIGTKYNSALIGLPFLLAHAFAARLRLPDGWRRFLGARLGIALAALAVTFLATTPFALFDLPHFLDDLASVIAHYNFGHTGFESDVNWRVYVPQFLASDFGPTLLALLGVALAFVRHRRADVVLVAFPVIYYYTLSSYRVNFPRNILPMLPFTTVLGALAAVVAGNALLRVVLAHRGGDARTYRVVMPLLLAGVVLMAVAAPAA
ncbi:MAG TPA: phospholipid carrier-dependent glycosyltransferase, partial [Chloroflexia bacterium]|nr:phospholipid carrier-dependent glycosyltransferase [Chloroflexia bacterium]